MGTVKHVFVSPVVDAGNAGEVGPSEWNADHALTGTFPPDTHVHAESDITGLTADLASKVNDTGDTLTGPLHFTQNNVAVLTQRNVANTADLGLPYIDNNNLLFHRNSSWQTGPVATTGPYANSFATIQAEGAIPGSGAILNLVSASSPGPVYAINSWGDTVEDVRIGLMNYNTAPTGPTSGARLSIYTNTATGGDPRITFSVMGVSDWAFGLDNDQGDRLAWATNTWLGSTDKMILDTSGNLTITGNITSPGLTSALASKSDTSHTHTFASITSKPTTLLGYGITDAVPSSQKGVANGVAPLDSGTKIDASYLPSIAVTNTFVVASQAAMLALTAQTGDVAVRTDLNKTFIASQEPVSVLANWQEMLTPTSPVQSVAGKTGAVTLVKGDVGLGNVDNTSDANKPVSTAQQTAIDGKISDTGDTLTGVLQLGTNNTPMLQQLNAAGSAYVNLPYIDSANGVRINPSVVINPGGLYVQGNVDIPTAPTSNNSAANKKYVDDMSGRYLGLSDNIGSAYTFTTLDSGKLVSVSNATAVTITVPPNSSQAFPVNSRLDFWQKGAGQITVAAGAGVTIRSSGGKLKLSGQYSAATLTKIATDEWLLFGDITL